jgi:hypothetical protein
MLFLPALFCLWSFWVHNVRAAGEVLVPAGSVWKYQAITNDIGIGWRLHSFNDDSWASGPAQLGYGDQDEVTRVPFVVDESGRKNISTYFRRSFLLTNRALVTNLIVRLLRDDGGIVYVNGFEVFRSNMPTGDVTHSTPALSGVGAPEEINVFFETNVVVPYISFREGLNAVAVEIHQVAPTSADISFDLELIAESMASRPPVVSISNPYSGTTFPTGANVEITASASDPDGAVAQVEFFADEQSIGIDASGPFSMTWSNLSPGPHTVHVLATDDSGVQTTSVPVLIAVGGLPLVSQGSVWNYLDDQTDPGTTWREPSFDDSSWSNGVAPLGFGDGDEATVIRWKIDEVPIVTAYFRKQFVSPDPSRLASLILRLHRDDGGVVYLNGHEVFRSNMPGGPVDYWMYAASSIGVGPEESEIYFPALLPAALLVEGTNTLAVEIHQITQFSSTDLSFDCELIAFPAADSMGLSIVQTQSGLVLSWPAWTERVALFTATSLTSPDWQKVSLVPDQVDGRWEVRIPAPVDGMMFFKLSPE